MDACLLGPPLRSRPFFFQMQMREDENCKTICKLDSLSKKQAKELQERIDDEYRITLCAPP